MPSDSGILFFSIGPLIYASCSILSLYHQLPEDATFIQVFPLVLKIVFPQDSALSPLHCGTSSFSSAVARAVVAGSQARSECMTLLLWTDLPVPPLE